MVRRLALALLLVVWTTTAAAQQTFESGNWCCAPTPNPYCVPNPGNSDGVCDSAPYSGTFIGNVGSGGRITSTSGATGVSGVRLFDDDLGGVGASIIYRTLSSFLDTDPAQVSTCVMVGELPVATGNTSVGLAIGGSWMSNDRGLIIYCPTQGDCYWYSAYGPSGSPTYLSCGVSIVKGRWYEVQVIWDPIGSADGVTPGNMYIWIDDVYRSSCSVTNQDVRGGGTNLGVNIQEPGNEAVLWLDNTSLASSASRIDIVCTAESGLGW